jgi:heme-degrading monooxygenase HmoA
MILELAEIAIPPDQQPAFDAAIAHGIDTVLSQSKGFRACGVHRAHHAAERYVLHVAWDTLEHHTVDFRQSDAFVRWRAIVGPFFAAPPRVEHFTPAYASPALAHPSSCAALAPAEHMLLADIPIRPGEHAAFETGIRRGINEALAQSKGFRFCSLHRGLESAERYLLHVVWQTPENYSADWRTSAGLDHWRKVVVPLFAQLPRVEQFVALTQR